MQISLAALTCLLLHSTFSSSVIVPQVPLDYAPTIGASYGYAGPGVYRIVNYAGSTAVSLNTSDSTTGLVGMPPVTDDDAQRWLITDVSPTEKMIINNGTGSILSTPRGGLGQSSTLATLTPPYNLRARWTMDFDRYNDYPGSPVMLRNVGRRNVVLDLDHGRKKAGTPVILYSVNNPRSGNQAWLLEYLEQSAPPAPPTRPAPPPTCDFPETPMQLLRGNIVRECGPSDLSFSYLADAKTCYNLVKDSQDWNTGEYLHLQAYVFTPYAKPGSPEEPGRCDGYKTSASHHFVGNPEGNSFGGDTALPYN